MRKKIYQKSKIDRYYHWKHLGSRIGLWALTNYYIISEQGLPQTKEQWVLFALLNFAYLGGAGISLDGAKKTSH